MFKAFIKPFIVTMDVEFPPRDTMLVKSIELVRYARTRVTYDLVPRQNMLVERDKDPKKCVFRFVSDKDKVRLCVGYNTYGSGAHQVNFIIHADNTTCYALRFYDHEFGLTDRKRIGYISNTYNQTMDTRYKSLANCYVADIWEDYPYSDSD